MRSLIETENVLNMNSCASVSRHLGHSDQIRDEFYVIPDRRHMIQAANRLLYILEDAGENEQVEEEEIELCDPVCHCCCLFLLFSLLLAVSCSCCRCCLLSLLLSLVIVVVTYCCCCILL